MTSKTNLANRIKKAKAAAIFTAESSPNTFIVPGSRGKQYRVKVERNGVISFECRGTLRGNLCLGNGNGTVCYHSIAVAEVLAAKLNKTISWCATEANAQRLGRIGGKVYKCIPANGVGELWMVVYEEEPEPEPEPTREEKAEQSWSKGNSPAASLGVMFWRKMREEQEQFAEEI